MERPVFDGRPLLSQVAAPTLVVRAERDAIVPRRRSEEPSDIAGARTGVLPGAQLSLPVRHHRALATAVEVFLDSTGVL